MIVPEFLSRRVQASGERPFVYFGDRVLSFAEVDRKSDTAAAFLRDLGIGKGDRVCLLVGNRPEFIELWFGLAKLGAVMVPLSTSLKTEGLSYIVNHSGATAIAVDRASRSIFEQVGRNLGALRRRIWIGPEREMPGGFVDYGRGVASAARPPAPAIGASDLMAIMYTSTGGGLPRGAMIPHFNYVNMGRTWAGSIVRAASDDVFFSTLPLYWMTPQATVIMGAIESGRPMVLGERFDPSRFFDEIRRYGATVFSYVGWMLTALMDRPRSPDDARNPARLTVGGAAPKDIWRPFEDRFGVRILEGYGKAETGIMCLVNFRGRENVGSVGKPLPYCEVKIVDASGGEPPAGTPGEIVVREVVPNTMFSGYYKAPDLTREVVRNGWFHSEDCGYVDETDHFHYLDRLKDCIRIRDKIIPSFEVEHVVNAHPHVIESAAVGVTSEPGVQDIRVFVVARNSGAVSPEEIVEWCGRRLAHFMVPRFVEFVRELPKTMTQRVRKDILRGRPLGHCWDGRQAGQYAER